MERNPTGGSKCYKGRLKSSEYYEGENCLNNSYFKEDFVGYNE